MNKPRLIAIIQLCFAFSLMFWHITQPFLGDYYAVRSRMILYEYLMGTSEILKERNGELDNSEQNAARFKKLPAFEKQKLLRDYIEIRDFAKRSAFSKIEDGMRQFLFSIPPFEMA